MQPNGDHGLEIPAERGGVDIGVHAADHAALDQCAYPAQAGRRRDTRRRGERVIGHATVAREMVEERGEGQQDGREARLDVPLGSAAWPV